MPPRKDKADEDKDSQANRLRDRAVKKGILAESQPAAPEVPLPLSKALLKSNGLDILKKSTTRRNRYLLILSCLLAPATSGKLGSLANLDSQEPCMYIDFPNGRLKLLGTLVFPRNKYLLLRTGGQQGVMCEDVFENMIVFSESWWVGTAEENPEERQLPLPAEMSATTIHSDYDFAYGASYTGGGKAGKVSGSQQDPPSQQGLGSQQVVASQQGPSQELPGSALRPRRAAAPKSYQGLASEDDDDDIEMEEDGEDEEERGHGHPIAGAARAIRPLRHDPIEILSTEDPDEHGRGRQGGQGSFDLEAKEPKRPTPRKRAAAPKRAFKDASSDEENNDGEEDEGTQGSEEDGSVFDGSEDEQPKRPKPATRKAAATAGRARKLPAGNVRGGPQSPAKRQRADPTPMPRSNQNAASQHKRGKAKSNASGAKENGGGNEDDDIAGERLGSDEQAAHSDDEDGDGGEGVLTAAEKRAAAAAAASGPRPTRSPRRAAARRITYAESDDDDDEEDEEEEEEEDGDEGGNSDEAFGGSEAGGDGGNSGDEDQRRLKRPAASQRRGRGGGAAARAAPRKKAKQANSEVFVIDSDDD